MKKFVNKEMVTEEELCKHQGYLVHKMICKNINSILANGKPLESVIISRMKYDMLEEFYYIYGFRTSDNEYAPLTFRDKEIKRAESSTMVEFTPIYRQNITEKIALEQLDENASNLKIEKGIGKKALDDAFKAIKKKR